ncbi:thioredoxin [Modestobacter altitudinis]|uniref:thioredoxin n=1 Tax=Modestobacter altitudinis TaxID=2213158 RepID=UPI00110CEEA8|nr:thioredoxin [Modestobacter altitudinis]
MTTLFRRLHMPPLDGATAWLNSAPLDPAGLRGKVVLVDFWTLTCINWLRTAPWVRAWAQAYRDDGLVVIGVHTPEFGFEHDLDLVRRAVRERGIDHPVAVDNGYRVWRAFDNHYWPALYFVDTDGVVRDSHVGEGRYEQSERRLQRLLGIDRPFVSVEGEGDEAAADWDHLRTPETYLGAERGGRPDAPGELRLGSWALTGRWTTEPEDVVCDEPGGSINFRFSARDAHLVLSSAGPAPIHFQVLLDGEAPGRSRGVDVDEQGNGVLDGGRLYQLVRQDGEVRERTLTLTSSAAGARAHVFTFG